MVKKEITFIYIDSVQKQVYEMIAEEARKRGYRTRITDDKFSKCEIGWYCEHVNHPQFSKFSVIMLHDITQQRGNWPDIWMREPWNKYDIGFLPNKVWVKNWRQCSQFYYTNPRIGVFLTGWPKADRLEGFIDKNNKELYAKKTGIDVSKPTILYAPAWENDNKQDDFVQAMMKLDVNILVKQAPWPDSYPQQLENIREMHELHEKNPRVIQIDPKVNILDVINISDVLVSEESSTMTECVMMGKPAISVSDWLIPDVTPSRLPKNDFNYLIKTNKDNLTNCVANVLEHYEEYRRKTQKYAENHFSNIGKCIPMMLDILDATIQGKQVLIPALKPRPRIKMCFKRYLKHIIIVLKSEIASNFCVRYIYGRRLYELYKKIKQWRNS